METSEIGNNVRQIISSLPAEVTLAAAGKTRTPEQIQAAIAGGVEVIGHNYVQEAEASVAAVGREGIKWHMIGHLQRNKAKKAVALFDMIETVDSLRLGKAIEKACAEAGRTMPVLVEVNSAEEQSKSGANPDEVEELVRALSKLEHIRIEGLMTMGIFSPDPEVCRPCFKLTYELFQRLTAADIEGVAMHHLSMGMSSSYQVAIEEGATMVRVGTAIFGPR